MKCRVSQAAVLALLTVAFLVGAGCSNEAKQARHRARAESYLSKGEYAKAEVEFMNALRFAPKDPALLRGLGRIYFEQGRMQLAYQALSLVKETDPQDADSRVRLGTLLLQVGDITNARVEGRFVFQQQPTNRQALFLLVDCARTPAEMAAFRQEMEQVAARVGARAEFHLALAELDFRGGRIVAAEQNLQRAATLVSQDPALNYGWAKLHLMRTNLSEAEKFMKLAAEAAPLRSNYRLQWAHFKVRSGEAPAAQQSLRDLTSKAPDYIPAWLLLADIALTQKNFEECETVTSRILKLDGGSYQARLLRGRMFLLQDQPDKAIEELARLETAFPRSPQVKYYLAVAYLRAGDTGRTKVILNQALQINPAYAEAVLLQSEMNLKSGNAAAAVAPLDRLLKENPEHVQAAMLLAAVHQSQNRNDEALRIYRDLAVRFPRNPQPLFLTGMMLAKERRFSEARAAMEKSLEVAPTYYPAMEQLVELDLAATNITSALARCAKFGSLQTNSAAPLYLEARVHLSRKDFDAAEKTLLRGLERDPDSSPVYSMLAALYIERKDYPRALERLDATVKRNPKLASAWMQKGTIHDALQQPAKAQEAYERAVQQNPRFAPALNNLAFLLAAEPARLEEAFAYATKARQAAPTDPSVADTLGWIQYKRRNFVAARGLLMESAERLRHAEVHYHLGVVEYALGHDQSARQSLETALQRDLNAKLSLDASNRLAVLSINPVSAIPADVQRLEAAVKRDEADYTAHLKLAQIYARQNDFSRAEKAFEAAARANPQSPQPLTRLALLMLDRDLSKALQLAKEARKLGPNDTSVALAYGTVALRARDYTGALVGLQEGVNAPESTLAARYDLAVAQFTLGRVREALVTLRSVASSGDVPVLSQKARDSIALVDSVDRDVDTSAIADARLKTDPTDLFALVGRARVHERRNNFKEAAGLYRQVIEFAPDAWPARSRLAVLCLDQLADDKEALAQATRVRQNVPTEPLAAQVLGRLALKRNDLPAALRYFQEAVNADANSAEAHYFLGFANYRLNRTNDSKTAFSKSLALNLKPEFVAEAKRMLEALD